MIYRNIANNPVLARINQSVKLISMVLIGTAFPEGDNQYN
jgi:hypothetical protein